jgi:hypothetical protein
MLLFRDEDEIIEWCEKSGEPRGEWLTLQQVLELSKLWYSNRMSPEYRGRSTKEAEAIFRQIGATSNFWKFR